MKGEVRIQVLKQGMQPYGPIVGLLPLLKLSRNISLSGSHVDPSSYPDPSRDHRNSLFDDDMVFFAGLSRKSLCKELNTWTVIVSRLPSLYPWLDLATRRIYKQTKLIRK